MESGLFALPTPFTPPTTEEDELATLRLIRSRRVGPATYFKLIAEYGTAQAALAALPEVARAAGVSGYAPCPEAVALAELRAGRRAGARLICHGQPGYPASLAEIPDAPPTLWARGDSALLARPMVALVGARNASSLGLRMARKLAGGLGAAGLVVVSGLARGIDAAAHTAAISTGTIAVLAGGVDVIYPPENADLTQAIAARGLLLSEQSLGQEPQARHFPMRNRIISGLVRVVVVVEAAGRSGSLITARLALDQGREVVAVPGHPLDARAAGCNALIRDGAALVRGAEDVLALLDGVQGRPEAVADVEAGARADAPGAPRAAAPRASQAPPAPNAQPLQATILDRLGPSPLAEDQLIRELALPASQIAPELLALEIEGRIERQAGGMLARVV
jgi:DNA processing protein